MEIKMANKSVFATVRGKLAPKAGVTNRAGGKAYDLGPRHKLAQLQDSRLCA